MLTAARARRAAAVAMVVCGLAGCAGSHRRHGPPQGQVNASAAALVPRGPVGSLLVHVLPHARLVTAVDLTQARIQLGLPADASPPPVTPPSVTALDALDAGARHGPLQALGQLSSLVLPLGEDGALFAALQRGQIQAAVQFAGVQQSGLSIETAQPQQSIVAGLLAHGWARTGNGFQYRHDSPGGEIFAHSRVVLFDGGLVIAYDPDDAGAAAAQTSVPPSDRALLAPIARVSAPARFAATGSGCVAGLVALEQLLPRVATVEIKPSSDPQPARVRLSGRLADLGQAGVLVAPPRLRSGVVEIGVRYGASAAAPAGTIIDLTRTQPVYRCS